MSFLPALMVLLCCAICMSAQVPDTIGFTVRNHEGAPVTNQRVNIRLHLYPDSTVAWHAYQEVHTVTTGPGGEVYLPFGKGKATLGKLTPTWLYNHCFMEVALDLSGGNKFIPIDTLAVFSGRDYMETASFFKMEEIPSELSFAQPAMEYIYRKWRVQWYEFSRESEFSSMFMVNLLSQEALAIPLPDNKDFALIINPNPIKGFDFFTQAAYRKKWYIGHKIEAFNPSEFDYSLRAYYNLLRELSGYTEETLLSALLDDYFGEADDPLGNFITYFNQKHRPKKPLYQPQSEDWESRLSLLLEQMVTNGNNYDLWEIAFYDYLSIEYDGPDYGWAAKSPEYLLYFFERDGSLEEFDKSLLPNYYIGLSDSIYAMQFPKRLLTPVDANNQVLDNAETQTIIEFRPNNGLSYTSYDGFECYDDATPLLFPPSIIGNTGLTIHFAKGIMDFDDLYNRWLEEYSLGLPATFKGIFITDAHFTPPPVWQPVADNKGRLETDSLFIGTEWAICGNIKLTNGPLIYTNAAKQVLRIDTFDIAFHKGEILVANISATLQDAKGKQPVPVEIDLTKGFEVILPEGGVDR